MSSMGLLLQGLRACRTRMERHKIAGCSTAHVPAPHLVPGEIGFCVGVVVGWMCCQVVGVDS